jgi:hypothetical protein
MKRKLWNLSADRWFSSRENVFTTMVKKIPQIGMDWHKETILENSHRNVGSIRSGRTIRELHGRGKHSAIVVSAGPSLYRCGTLKRIKEMGFTGDIIAIDGSYIQCLKAGIVPDYVVTLDPHPTRVVRWFGDPDFEKNSQGDDYFARQDLDVSFRAHAAEENEINIALIDSANTPLVLATCSPENVVRRTKGLARYWFAPLVDNPEEEGLTQEMVKTTSCPALNTGGTVGTAAVVFASTVLECKRIAVVGMDLGYYLDTPLSQTQSYHMVKGDPEMYHWEDTPYGRFYTDPTYFWYRQNLLDLLEANNTQITNCTGAGMLYGKNVINMELEEWLKSSS